MRVKCKARCTKKLAQNDDWFLFGMRPIPPYSDDIKVNVYGSFSVAGELGFLTENKEFTLEMEEIETNKYGTTYKVLACELGDQYDLDNLTLERSMEIMCEITTPSQAKYCLDAYKDFIKIALTEGVDGFDIKKIHNVGEFRINAYVRELNTKFKYLDLMNKLKDWEFEISETQKLSNAYSNYETIDSKLKANPYDVLITTLGKNFKESDKIIMKNRPDLELSEIRCAYFVASIIEEEEIKGNTKVNANDLYFYIVNPDNGYSLSKEFKDLLVPTIKKNPLFHYDEEEKSVALSSVYNAEYNIAQFFWNKVVNSTKLDIDYTKYTEVKDGTLTDEQQAILKHYCEHNLTIVNAKGGTGKSASSMALMQLMEDNGLSFMTVSPTGKVAKRLRELTGRPACTIHKAVLTHPEGVWVDSIIVEEGGMLSVELMSMLINSLTNPDCRIIINLDLRQIPPVGGGCPLRDIILSEIIDVNKLTKVFRYGEGGLAKMASDSYDQIFYIKDFMNEDKAVVGKNKDYTYIRYKTEQQAIKAILDTYMQYIKEDKAKPEDICVVTPWNVNSLGAIALSNKIQALINPNTDPKKSITKKIRGQSVTFKVGDIILNTENNYSIMTLTAYHSLQSDETLTKHDVPMGTCMNGELGKIVNIEDGNIIAKFDEDILVFDKKSQDKLMLGYSLTTYKMQGSEIPYGIALITPQFLKTMNSNIAYTGLSRGRKKMTEIIDVDVLAKIITIDGIMDRETNMQKIFKEICA